MNKPSKKATKKNIDTRILKIAEKIKAMRKAKGYKSYDVFAWDNELSRISYWRMETGVNFRIETLLKVLDVHKISLSDFFKDIK